MPSREWQFTIHDIITSIIEIQEFTEGLTFEDFQADKKTVKAVLYNFTFIGEAARNISIEIQSKYSQIP